MSVGVASQVAQQLSLESYEISLRIPFPLRISSVNVTKKETANGVTFTEDILETFIFCAV